MSNCKHETFGATVNVNRIEDTGNFSADIRIVCTQCLRKFCFKGFECGVSRNEALVSIDATELRAPIYPQGDNHSRDTILAGFKVVKEEGNE